MKPSKESNGDCFEFLRERTGRLVAVVRGLRIDDPPFQAYRRGVSPIVCVQLGEDALDSALNSLLRN